MTKLPFRFVRKSDGVTVAAFATNEDAEAFVRGRGSDQDLRGQFERSAFEIVSLGDLLAKPHAPPATDEEIADILTMSACVTDLPWVVCRESDEAGTIGMPVARMERSARVVVGHPSDWGEPKASPEQEARYIALACSLAPRLASEALRSRAGSNGTTP